MCPGACISATPPSHALAIRETSAILSNLAGHDKRRLPSDLPRSLQYRPADSISSDIRLKIHQRFLSCALTNEHVGLVEVDDGIWNIIYYRTLVGRIDERDGRITGVQSVKKLPGLL